MNTIDYVIVGVVSILFIVALVYVIKNKGCTDSKCKNCMKNCSKRKQ